MSRLRVKLRLAFVCGSNVSGSAPGFAGDSWIQIPSGPARGPAVRGVPSMVSLLQLVLESRNHGSWLNIVETLFGKMARTFLRHIRVQLWEELRDRILLGGAETNAAPVVHRWKKFDALTT